MSQFEWTGNPFVDTGLAVIIARAKELKLSVSTISDLTPEVVEQVTKSRLTDSSDEFSWLPMINRKLNSYTMIFSSNNPLTNASTNIDLVLENNKKKSEEVHSKIMETKSEIDRNNEELRSEELSLQNAVTDKDRQKSRASIEKLKKKNSKLEGSLGNLQKKAKDLGNKRSKQETKKSKNAATADQGMNEYKEILQDLLTDICKKTDPTCSICEATGIYQSTESLERLGKSVAKEWFPLAGTLSDAQSLPSSSRAIRLSAISLLAVQFLPVGVGLVGKRLVCFQTNDYAIGDVPIFQLMVENIYNETVTKAYIMEKVETWGKGNAYSSISLLLLGHLTALAQRKAIHELPDWISLNMWCFSNSGTEPALEIIEIPNEALQFLWEAWRSNHKDELERYLRAEEDFENKLLECIKDRKEYFPFYPSKNNKKKVSVGINNLPDGLFDKLPVSLSANLLFDSDKRLLTIDRVITEKERQDLLSLSTEGDYVNAIKKLCAKSEYNFNRSASIELFELYTAKILGYSSEALDIAKWVGTTMRHNKFDFESLFQFGDFKLQLKTLKGITAELMNLTGEGFSLEHYLLLFPSTVHPLRIDLKKQLTMARIIGFYASCDNLQSKELPMIEDISKYAHPKYSKIKSFAKDFFDYYVGEQGKDRFEKRILSAFKREQVSPRDIENWFSLLAEIKEGYTNEEWDDLCRDENGSSEVWEVIFQLRLELANLYRIKYQSNNP